MLAGMTTLEIAALLAGYALALARLLNAGRALWAWVKPTWLQPLLPALVTILPLLATQLGAADTKIAISEALLMAFGALATAVRGEKPVPPLALALLFFGFVSVVPGCAGWKPAARTADGLAETMCAQFFSEQKPGLSLEDAAAQFCATHDDLKPFIDAVLSAKASAGKAALAKP